jgi:hypothetical protein
MNGVFYGSAEMVKSQIFPRRADVTLENVESYIQEMEALDLIYRYEAAGDVWQCWPGFAENQPNLRRDRERPEYPLPPGIDGTMTADDRRDDGKNPAEEKLREGNSSKENLSGDSPSGDVQRNFQQWHTYIKEAENDNRRIHRLWEMCKGLYPGLDPPEHGYIGKVAKRLHAGRLADLLWQCASHPPTGDLLAYIQGVAKNGTGKRAPKTQEPAGVTGWEDP